MRVTLMHREREVLSFELDRVTGAASKIEALEGVSLAPLDVRRLLSDPRATVAETERALTLFVAGRAISFNRPDLARILAATGAASACDLALRAHGLSLSDHFWYRTADGDVTWKGSNFFDNDWDPAFGKGVLDRDYDALARADAVVPSVVCTGASRKAWVDVEGVPRLLKASRSGGGQDPVGEVLSSRMLARILPAGEFVPYELVWRNGEPLSSCPVMVGGDEDFMVSTTEGLMEGYGYDGEGLIPQPRWIQAYEAAVGRLGVADPERAVCKMAVTAALMLRTDIHASNYGFVRDAATGAVRPAPLFDLAGGFGTYENEFMRMGFENPWLASMLAGAFFSALDPTWDYSWLEPAALDGFGEELEESLARDAGWSAERCAAVRILFANQVAFIGDLVG